VAVADELEDKQALATPNRSRPRGLTPSSTSAGTRSHSAFPCENAGPQVGDGSERLRSVSVVDRSETPTVPHGHEPSCPRVGLQL
jgi:hypothetical protein